MKKTLMVFAWIFLGVLCVLNIPLLLAHDEEVLLAKIKELEAKIAKQEKQIQHLRSTVGLPHQGYPEQP